MMSERAKKWWYCMSSARAFYLRQCHSRFRGQDHIGVRKTRSTSRLYEFWHTTGSDLVVIVVCLALVGSDITISTALHASHMRHCHAEFGLQKCRQLELPR